MCNRYGVAPLGTYVGVAKDCQKSGQLCVKHIAGWQLHCKAVDQAFCHVSRCSSHVLSSHGVSRRQSWVSRGDTTSYYGRAELSLLGMACSWVASAKMNL